MVTHDEAERRVNLGFAIHAAVYAAVTGGLATMNFTNNPDKMWSLWVAGGWGIGVFAHGVAALLVPEQRERMVQKTAERMKRRRLKRSA